jgi:LPS export ABC transporter protein LptC
MRPRTGIRAKLAWRRGVPALAAGFVLAAACTDEPTGAEDGRGAFIPTDYQIIEGFALTQTVDGIRNAEIVADSTWQWADSTVVRLFGVQMNFFDSLGAPSARATADESRLDSESRDMELRGNAVLNVFSQNTMVQSPVLYYAPEADLIRSDTVTRATIDGDLITGTRFESDLQFRNITIDRPVGAIPDVTIDTLDTASGRVGDTGVDDGRERGDDDDTGRVR